METEKVSLLEKPACLSSQAHCRKCYVNMMCTIYFFFYEKDVQLRRSRQRLQQCQHAAGGPLRMLARFPTLTAKDKVIKPYTQYLYRSQHTIPPPPKSLTTIRCPLVEPQVRRADDGSGGAWGARGSTKTPWRLLWTATATSPLRPRVLLHPYL